MGYNKELFADVRRQMETRRQTAIETADARRWEIYAALPEVEEIDRELSRTGLMIMDEISKGKEGLSERLENIRLDNLDLQAQREAVLRRAGYPADYDSPKYVCPDCKDTGYVGQKMCVCLKAALSEEGMRRAGLSHLFETQRFDTFLLDYYRQDPRVYRLMQNYLEICRGFAERFDGNTRQSLLLCGGTGLGKTHLSTAIAGEIVQKGFDVLYESAPNLLSAYEAERFGRSLTASVADTSRYLTCDLLVIDDLGAELSNSFTVGVLYNLINTRIVSCRSTIISTNLNPDEIRSRYTDRIASRLHGEYTVMRFEGRDIRLQKIGMN
ncbi:MAG: ATP-binding protein [Clostridia bacterium]|nr:ATP-binding protein [Clostridia bacterium]